MLRLQQVEKKLSADVILPPPSSRAMAHTTERVVCIGASTGGTESLAAVLTALPVDCAGIIIVQHRPERFTAAFAKRLNGACRIEVKEAEDGDAVLPGRADRRRQSPHAAASQRGPLPRAVKEEPLASRHRPSVAVLFRSAAQYAGGNAVGIIMTGIGR